MGELEFAQEHLAEFVTAGAGMFKPEWFDHRYDPVGKDHFRLPDGELVHRHHLRRFLVVDLAVSTKTTADYTVVMACGRTKDRRLLILDVDRARREGPDIVPAIQAMVAVAGEPRVDRADGVPARDRPGGPPGRGARPGAEARPGQGLSRDAGHGRDGGRPGAAPALGPLASGLRDGGALLSGRPVDDDQVDCLSYAVAVQNTHTGFSLANCRPDPNARRRRRQPTIAEMFEGMGPNDPGDEGVSSFDTSDVYEPWRR